MKSRGGEIEIRRKDEESHIWSADSSPTTQNKHRQKHANGSYPIVQSHKA